MDRGENSKIDFVIAWVDGSDPNWLEEKRRYDRTSSIQDDREVRFRDWDLLRYWFRGVETNAPWVNKIYFVTWGHVPGWLNTAHPKLQIVNHKDYIPEPYLPTFNSHTIELNLHRIPGLSEQFVYFNDDMYLLNSLKPEDFFQEGKPCDLFSLDALYFNKGSAGAFNGNNMEIINSHFDKKQQYKKWRKKWLCPKYSIRKLYRTLALLPYPWFPGFYCQHIPEAYLKSTFQEVWEQEYEILDRTCRDRFRSRTNVNQWLFKYWQLASGNFVPRRLDIGLCYHLRDANFEDACRDVRTRKYPMLCLNDTPETENPDDKMRRLQKEFALVFPDKSGFEK